MSTIELKTKTFARQTGKARRQERAGRSLNCVDLFAGAGGFSLAAQAAGLRVLLAVENDGHALATYRSNICCGPTRPLLIGGDIREIAPHEVQQQVFGQGKRCDLLLGGPPCQGFSTHRINDAGVFDARNDLLHIYFNFVRALSPTVFLLENVPGMLWKRHAKVLDRFYVEGARAGYHVMDPVVVDARDYGVPQRRKRVFILGIRAGVPLSRFQWPPPKTHGNPAAILSNRSLLPWRNCRHVFSPARADDVNDVHMNHNEELVEAFRRTPRNGGSRRDSGRVLSCHKDHDGHKDVYGRIDPSQPAPTMTTACINPSKGRFVHPVLHHGITARQAARIQTFPEHFVFKGGLMAAGIQIGNAVPIHLGIALIQHLVPLLEAN